MFEVEFRAQLSEQDYTRLTKFLETNGSVLGADDKDCVYYIYPDKLLKLVNNVSKQNAKISLKLNKMGQGTAFEEIEALVDPAHYDHCKRILDIVAVGAKVMTGPQKRVNYLYKECEIALKYSDTWKHHIEIEKMITSRDLHDEAERDIRAVADELGIRLMTEEELAAFTKAVEDALP